MGPHTSGVDSPKNHRVGEHYGTHNPVPTIQKFLEHLEKDKQDRKAHEEAVTAREKEEDARGEAKPHKPRKRPGKGKTRMVTDPTTGREIEVEDQDADSMEVVKNPKPKLTAYAKIKDVRTSPSQSLKDYKENQDITAPPDPIAEGTTSDVPLHGEITNVLFHPTPSISYKPMYDQLEKRGTGLCIGIVFGILFVGRMFGGSLWALFPLAACIASGVWLWAIANLLPESVEWMNSFLGVIWGLINPEMLSPIADTIEDIMQASAPSVVENVRIAEIDQGNNPLRILSLRALPDEHVQHIKDNVREENLKNKDPQEAAAMEEGGSYYNIEASFAYHAKPTGQTASSKARNMHMQLVFYLGIRGLFGVPFPVFVELIEMVGTVRIRFQLMPEAPFMKDMTFSLVGIPHVRAGCMPMFKAGVNILNLPLISNFVNYAIGTACGLFAAPKSMTMDLSMILKGDDIIKETQALGIMWVRIHRAIGLSKQDRRGSYGGGSDPYINLSFSKYGKPMYCTRVITDDLNPVWEETAALLVNPELISADENLSVELWDSDRNTADDIVGKVELPIREMIQHPARMYPQVSKLQGLNEGSEMPGELHWEVGFFGKPKLRPELRTDGKKKDLPENLRDNPQFQDDKGVITNEEEDAVTHTPPDPLWPSGILSIVVHQIVNLQLANIKGSRYRKGREYEPAKPYGENTEEEGGDLPTSYCKIILNDQLRYREHDPILGVVPLKLSEILQTSSQVTRWYPLDGGIGYGRIRISLLLRHVETRLPPNMLGWDVGTFEFASDKIIAKNFNHRAKIKLRTGGSSGKIPRYVASIEGQDTSFNLTNGSLHKSIRLPVKHRYRSPVVFEFYSPGKHGAAAYAVLWLQHLVDNEDTPVDLPLWSTKNGKRLTQNYITEENWEAKREPGLEDLQIIGRLQFTCRFTPGIDESHEHYVVDNHSRETYETWEACIAEGVRPRSISLEVPEETEQMHERSLVDGRDVLKHADPKERRQWIDKQGQDWSGAFGNDPSAFMDHDGHKVAEPGRDKPPYSADGHSVEAVHPEEEDDDDEGSSVSSSSRTETSTEQRLSTANGSQLTSTDTPPSTTEDSLAGSSKENKHTKKANRRSEQRQQRGMMQWKPARNAVFAGDEAKFALRKVRNRFTGNLTGREPDIETETGN
ncbi:unnamed protein product [Aspergillus oryzae]|uniref:Unnamed protein product n=1 Tax=Aspergillus oryzae TaxID=5062 RepID=A0AAN4YDA1_ASPOZ|nr:unnamed protein product [Aspergillus oryzae]